MKLKIAILVLLGGCLAAHAEDSLFDGSDRDPSSVSGLTPSSHRNYPGGADEDDLQVQSHLTEVTVKTDAHMVQKEVYKTLYNEELKDNGREAVDE